MRCFVGSRKLLRNTYLIIVNDFQEDVDAFCDLFDFSTLPLHTKLFCFPKIIIFQNACGIVLMLSNFEVNLVIIDGEINYCGPPRKV